MLYQVKETGVETPHCEAASYRKALAVFTEFADLRNAEIDHEDWDIEDPLEGEEMTAYMDGGRTIKLERDEICEANMKLFIEGELLRLFTSVGMDKPTNFQEIADFVFYDMIDTADLSRYNNADVTIGFRRWMEAQNQEK